MVFRKISKDLKECALDLWERGWTEDDIRYALGVSRRSLYRWRNLFDELGTVVRPPSPLQGRPKIITRHILDAMVALYHDHPDTYLDELQTWLAVHHDIDISLSGIQKNLAQAGLTLKLLHRIAKERDEEQRAQWMETVQDTFERDGQQLIFIDEASKNDRTTARRRGRAPSGKRADAVQAFGRGQRYSVVAALDRDGYVAARAVPGSVDGFEFFDFIAEEVLPSMNPWPDTRSVLIMDNCRIHHSDALAELVQGTGCMLLFLPLYSPDLNPIEESFSTWKAYLRRNGLDIDIAEVPEDALMEACGVITSNMAYGWFKHAGHIW